MTRVPYWCYVLVAAAGFLSASARSQSTSAGTRDATSLQQQSAATQMNEIALRSAQTQADSIRRQAASIRQQYGVPVDGNVQSTLESAAENIRPANSGPAPKTNTDPVGADLTSAKTNEENPEKTKAAGFFTVPWPASGDFVMPSVQVGTNACDALGDGELGKLINDASGKYKLDPTLLRAVMRQESGLHPCAISTAGAMGLMQIMPDTAGDLGLADPFDPSANVDAGAHYLKQMLDRYNGNTALALAAYNAGPGRTDKANGIPPIAETIGYVSSILSSIPLF